MKGITLIGMSGSGKSTIGRILAQKLNWKFVDLDKLILERQSQSHHAFMDANGEDGLLKLEEEYTLGLDFSDTVFAPPGSIVYSSPSVEKVKNETVLIYIAVTPETVTKRLGERLYKNGIVGLREKGLQKVMEERAALYEKCADYTFHSGDQSKEEFAEKILAGIHLAR